VGDNRAGEGGGQSSLSMLSDDWGRGAWGSHQTGGTAVSKGQGGGKPSTETH